MTKKETTLHDVDALILEKVILLKTCDTKEEKEKLRKQILRLEKHFNDCNDKTINGKKYPPKDLGYKSETSGLNDKEKKEIYNIISKTDTYENNHDNCYTQGCFSTDGVYVTDPSGVAVGKDRFIEIDQDIDIRTHEK